MTEEIKKLKNELKEWKSPEVRERFKQVDSMLPTVKIKELEQKIKRLKRGEDI
jgi:hypothetical protein